MVWIHEPTREFSATLLSLVASPEGLEALFERLRADLAQVPTLDFVKLETRRPFLYQLSFLAGRYEISGAEAQVRVVLQGIAVTEAHECEELERLFGRQAAGIILVFDDRPGPDLTRIFEEVYYRIAAPIGGLAKPMIAVSASPKISFELPPSLATLLEGNAVGSPGTSLSKLADMLRGIDLLLPLSVSRAAGAKHCDWLWPRRSEVSEGRFIIDPALAAALQHSPESSRSASSVESKSPLRDFPSPQQLWFACGQVVEAFHGVQFASNTTKTDHSSSSTVDQNPVEHCRNEARRVFQRDDIRVLDPDILIGDDGSPRLPTYCCAAELRPSNSDDGSSDIFPASVFIWFQEEQSPLIGETARKKLIRLCREANADSRKGSSIATEDQCGCLPGPASPLFLPENKKIALAVITGPDIGKIFQLETSLAVIGQVNAGIALSDPAASPLHCAIEIRGDRFVLVDLRSESGTFLEGKKIFRSLLHDKNELTVGNSTLMLVVLGRDTAGGEPAVDSAKNLASPKSTGSPPQEKSIAYYSELANRFLKAGQVREAVAALRQAAALSGETSFHLKTIALYKMVLTYEPDDLGIRIKIAGLYERMGLQDEAIAWYGNVAQDYEKQGLLIKAFAMSKRIIAIRPADLPTRDRLARLLLAMDDKNGAADQYVEMAAILAAASRVTEARDFLIRALSLVPEHSVAKRRLDRL